MLAFGGCVYFFVYFNRDLSTKNSTDLRSFLGRIEDEKGTLKAIFRIYAGKKQKHAGFLGKDSKETFPFLPTFFFKNNEFQVYFPVKNRLFFVFLGRKWLL